jgi:hypothetical protein
VSFSNFPLPATNTYAADQIEDYLSLGMTQWAEGIIMKKADAKSGASPAEASRLIDASIKALGDWRGETLRRIRALIKDADPQVVEEWKWDIPVWSHDGLICTGETYKAAVKTTFARGASLPDPSKLFNSSLEGGTRRAIDFKQGAGIDEKAFKALIQAAVALNTSKKPLAKKAAAKPAAKRKAPAKKK